MLCFATAAESSHHQNIVSDDTCLNTFSVSAFVLGSKEEKNPHRMFET